MLILGCPGQSKRGDNLMKVIFRCGFSIEETANRPWLWLVCRSKSATCGKEKALVPDSHFWSLGSSVNPLTALSYSAENTSSL